MEPKKNLKENKPGTRSSYRQEIDWIMYEVDFVPDDIETYKKWPEPWKTKALKALKYRKQHFDQMSKDKLKTYESKQFKLANIAKKNLKEGKWNHDAVGRSGPISVYSDGTESVKFYMENDKWMYSVTKPNGDQAPGFSFGKSTGTVDAQYSKYFDNGNIRGMTVAAKKILKEGMIHESKQFNLMNIVKKILKESSSTRSFDDNLEILRKFDAEDKSYSREAREILQDADEMTDDELSETVDDFMKSWRLTDPRISSSTTIKRRLNPWDSDYRDGDYS